MKSARKFKIILPALVIGLACACAIIGVMLMQTWREYSTFEQRRDDAQQRLSALHEQNYKQQHYLTELLNNPDMIERATRERLGYSREGELVFKFGE